MPGESKTPPKPSAFSVTERPQPVAPFAGWPVQHFEPSVGFYWLIEPSILICQTIAPHGSLDVINRHNDVVDRVLERRRAQITADGGLFIVFDWRSVRGYDQDARARQRERMQARGKAYARRTVIAIQPSNTLLRMAVAAANLFATMLFKSGIELVSDPTAVVTAQGMRPPPAGKPLA